LSRCPELGLRDRILGQHTVRPSASRRNRIGPDLADGRTGRLQARPRRGILNDWLVWTKNAEFESDYAAMAFDELVDFVYLLRDIAQDFCV
jgi:hypothetical protein